MTKRIEVNSLHNALLASVNNCPDEVAIRDAREALTYNDLLDRVNIVAAQLIAMGLQSGDAVIVALPNSVEFVISHFGVLVAGGVSVPLATGVSLEAFSDIALKTGCRIASTIPKFAPACTAVGIRIVEEFACVQSAKPQWSARQGDDLATILFTTGSTGYPKGVMLSHNNTLFTVNNLVSALGYVYSRQREMITLPLAHSFGLGHLYCNLFTGGMVYLEAGLSDFKKVFEAIGAIDATGFPGTPSGFGMLIDYCPAAFKLACANIQFMVINSEKLPPRRTLQLKHMLPNTEIFVYYGLTEASRSTLISLTRAGPELYDCAGNAMPGVKLRIDPSSEEVLITGPHVAKGYWKDPILTDLTFQNGWIKTGDSGRLDEMGRLFITGRLKNQINTFGYKVDPCEIENVILASGFVADAAVFGVAQARLGEFEIVACVLVPHNKGNSFDQENVARLCFEKLERYKVPRRWVIAQHIPRTENGKVRYSELKKLFAIP